MIRKKCDILKLMVYRGIEMDNLTPDQRKKNMQHIRSDNTKIETILRKALWDKGYRYRKNYKDLPGKPDIVLTKYKIAIFCDGEFFHGKDWEVLKRIYKGRGIRYGEGKVGRRDKRIAFKRARRRLLGL